MSALQTVFTDIADAIREKTGKADKITPANMASEIEGISVGGGDGDSVADAIIDGSVTAINSDAESVQTYAFYRRKKLVSANVNKAETIGNSVFYECTALTSVNIDSARYIETKAFYGCSALTSIYAPYATKVTDSAFSQCKGLLSAVIYGSTGLFSSAFYYCENLKKIEMIFASNIKSYAFGECKALVSVVLRGYSNTCSLENINAFINTPVANGTGYIYVPSALIDTYKTATNWSTFASQFRALEDYTADGTITGELDETKI